MVCMEADIKSGIADFYQRLGFRFLARPAYFINHGMNEVADNNVMLMGLLDKQLGKRYLRRRISFVMGIIWGIGEIGNIKRPCGAYAIRSFSTISMVLWFSASLPSVF